MGVYFVDFDGVVCWFVLVGFVIYLSCFVGWKKCLFVCRCFFCCVFIDVICLFWWVVLLVVSELWIMCFFFGWLLLGYCLCCVLDCGWLRDLGWYFCFLFWWWRRVWIFVLVGVVWFCCCCCVCVIWFSLVCGRLFVLGECVGWLGWDC